MDYSIADMKQKYSKYKTLFKANPSNKAYKHKLDKYKYYLQKGGALSDETKKLLTDAGLNDDIGKYSNDGKSQNGEVIRVEKDVEKANNVATKAKELITNLHNALKGLMEKYTKLANEKTALEAYVAKIKEDLVETKKAHIDVGASKDLQEKIITELNAKLAEAQKNLGAKVESTDELISLIKNLQTANDALQSVVDNTKDIVTGDNYNLFNTDIDKATELAAEGKVEAAKVAKVEAAKVEDAQGNGVGAKVADQDGGSDISLSEMINNLDPRNI